MATISTQDIQDIAVKCASEFFNSNIPLDNSLAKEASDRSLNSDQLKRAVEATNTISHLKMIELAKDRTSEFQVADYNNILKLACVPNQTSVEDEVISDVNAMQKSAEDLAEQSLHSDQVTISEREYILHIQKQAQINKRAMESVKEELDYNYEKLMSLIKIAQKDPNLIDSLSVSDATDTEFTKIATLLTGEKPIRREFLKGIIKSAEVNTAQELVTRYRRSSELMRELSERQEMEKVAFMPVLSMLGRSVAKTVAAGSNAVGKSLGQGLVKTVSAPVKLVAKGVSRPFKALAGAAGTKLNNAVAQTHLGKEMGMTTRPINPNIKKNFGTALTVGGAVLDASTYSPGKDISKGQMGSVWETLQR